MAPIQHPSLHGETLLQFPIPTLLTSAKHSHSHHLQSPQQPSPNRQQHQHSPESLTSLEDPLLGNTADTLLVDSSNSANNVRRANSVVESTRVIDNAATTIHAIDSVHTFDHDNSSMNPKNALPSNVVRGPLATLAHPTATRSRVNIDINNLNKSSRNNHTVVPGLMMATSPLSPTRQQSIKEMTDLERPKPIVAMPPLVPFELEDRKRIPPMRSRAGSAPPPTKGMCPIRSPSPLSITYPYPHLVSVVAPRIHFPGQPTPAWAALLPGVTPVRVDPRSLVQPMFLSLSSEQRLHQQVPIILSPEREARLTTEMYSLFETLLPTEESHQRRTQLISKIERIIHAEWPGQDIKVLPFGSTVNDLGTNSSDVDICILTSWLGLQGVEMLADVFRKHAMENVFCVLGAKVPIVKLWDPELQLSCDMNINTQLGIMNSRMVKTYVAIDRRVRPFAMIIKHWARKRVLNDAANGGTISTYTWICMVINFLQMRSPPILPSLHDMPHELSPDNQVINGNNTSFFSDIDRLEGFGQANKESLGGLLYAFFRRFAIEFDYDHHVVSVRHACYLTKESKDWHLPGKHYRLLCVEEPFDTSRNLGNSCDMASSKGLKQEFRRALDILNNGGSLDQVCEQWVFPPRYYHNRNAYHRTGGHGGFLVNNHTATGRRYVGGFDGQHHKPNGYRKHEAEAIHKNRYMDSSQFPHAASPFHPVDGQHERGSHEKRQRSNSAYCLKDTAPHLATTNAANFSRSTNVEYNNVVTTPIIEEADTVPYVRNKNSRNKEVMENAANIDSYGQNRIQKEKIRAHDENTAPNTSAKNGEKVTPTKTVPSITSLNKSKTSGRSQSRDGPKKGHTEQKNGRSSGYDRDGTQGSKGPRATVELCLADIANIVKKSDDHQLTRSSTQETNGGESSKKKKSGKRNVLWSTNSNRGEPRSNHQNFKQEVTEHTKSKSMAVATGIEEAGSRVDSAVAGATRKQG
ncbi:hypothetical protein BX616_009664 [Lobosporangium transversale]|uniref:polynucleotide adenylyltransferase n=1 Tax=Lobosporangium transversale TaxID=64571 RepID=A0A1Y2H6Y7_9FUNG|nr:hypothetical protein BCR41DRAFT_391234 [Lobosporangium transversale]KAF9918272.1 hypothetical protein BX616_009664 [Lobosporangium transversale]ORZ28812.1 hypothetical protein BCR41DRAFT_391234 [Lobosporangium transversale]|eukprot:XP_021886485.1 hypothetical protein BCR41DRAFT_391234 [Lobosporangium transversale]